jgi:hypothetical protein
LRPSKIGNEKKLLLLCKFVLRLDWIVNGTSYFSCLIETRSLKADFLYYKGNKIPCSFIFLVNACLVLLYRLTNRSSSLIIRYKGMRSWVLLILCHCSKCILDDFLNLINVIFFFYKKKCWAISFKNMIIIGRKPKGLVLDQH